MMLRYFFRTIQGKIVVLFVIFMTLVFAVSYYMIRDVAHNAMVKEKETKLIYLAIYQDKLLGEQSYDSILAEAGAADAGKDEQINVLNRALAERTEEVASLFPGLGTGYYSLKLDALLTYGPSAEYSNRVGLSIDADHPGRVVMSKNIDLVREGSMVRGEIMNAMHPIVRGGEVIGYAWANELTSEIEAEYINLSNRIITFLAVFYFAFLVAAILLSRRLISDIDTVVTGVKKMRTDLTTRIVPIGGELGEVAVSINSMAEDIEKSVEEHDALLRAEAANAAQREFLSRMSHELRTPMNAVIGMAKLAQQTDDTGKTQECLKKINSAANHLLGVINDVLDMSKIEAGKLELSMTVFAFRQMLDQVITVAECKINEKRQSFTLELCSNVPEYIVTDGQRLAQVITNLLNNASKFTKEGGNICLRIRRLVNGGETCLLRIEVQDNGIGISWEQQQKLFQPFEQADNSISRKYGGSGLGLVICKRIVELMNGRIWIDSEPGRGSSFIFEIEAGIGVRDNGETAETAKAVLDAVPDGPEDGAFEGKHILLAEDIEINREIVLELLEPTLVRIDCAENGVEALRMFGEAPEKYDLIFMDVHMPEMDGYEATRLIRMLEAPSAKTVPIIAMTANVFQEDIDKCLEAGMFGHVGKPLDFGEVLAQLRKWLR